MTNLKQRLDEVRVLLAPGVYDALSALIAEQAGFDALYLSGASIAYTRLGRSDVGLTTYSEVEDVLARITDRVRAPVIVDADTGFGNALNVQRTVRSFERAGANAIQLEDQSFPKRCGHLEDKTIISTGEMVGKIQAAVDTRHSERTLIVARTDAVAVEGLASALDRAARYRDAGADMLFIEAPTAKEQLAQITGAIGVSIPLMVNLVEGGKTPSLPADDLEQLGFALAIFPGGIVRALARTAVDYYASLAAHRSTEPFRSRMYNFSELNELLGTPEMLERGQRYAPEADTLRSKKGTA